MSYGDVYAKWTQTPILMEMPKPTPITELIPIPRPISNQIPETDSGPTVRNRFQKTAELPGTDFDENFIFPITSTPKPTHKVKLHPNRSVL